MNGTSGESKRLEAIKIQLTGEEADLYDIYYRVHVQSFGWLNWAKNGEAAGTAGYSKRLEAIQIIIIKKGHAAPEKTYYKLSSTNDSAYIYTTGGSNPKVEGADKINVWYRAYVQGAGWQEWKWNGKTSGTSGKGLRIESIQLKLTNNIYGGTIIYRVHMQNYGWLDYVEDGTECGYKGKGKRIEAINIALNGEIAKHYNIVYRTHVQNYGWMEWVSNGRLSGTTGKAKRIEAYKVKLEDKV